MSNEETQYDTPGRPVRFKDMMILCNFPAYYAVREEMRKAGTTVEFIAHENCKNRTYRTRADVLLDILDVRNGAKLPSDLTPEATTVAALLTGDMPGTRLAPSAFERAVKILRMQNPEIPAPGMFAIG